MVASVGRPPSISRAGAGAWVTPSSQVRQAYLGRRTQQHLVFGQRLRPAAEAMPLQLLDDLTQPFVLHSLGEQHRFQRRRQCVARHHQIRSYSAELCDDLPGS